MIGQLIVERRRVRGLSQAQLAEATGLNQTYISRVERGEVALPQRANLQKFGAALGIALPEFYRAAGVLEAAVDADVPEGADGPDDPLLDVIAWLRADPALVADFADAKRSMTPRVYRDYIRTLAATWAANYTATIGSFRLAGRAESDEEPDDSAV